MEKFFELKARGTDVKTEVMAGITTFMTMAYILAVNPIILGAAGMDTGAIFTATALASALATFLMAFLANMPFVLSAGMGLNAYFAYTVVIGMGYTWQQALAAIFVEGIIFILLSLVNIREAIFNAIPPSLKIAVSVGIGLFISFIGLQNAHIVVAGPTLVTLFSFKGSVENGTFASEGITVLLALIGLLITAFLLIRNVKGSVLFGIIATWGLGMICQAIGLYVPNPEKGFFSLFPNGIISMPASLEPTLMQVDFSGVLSFEFFTVLMAFLFVDLFDTIGTVIGCASKANLLDADGKLPKVKQVLLTDALGTTAGSLLGTSTITTFVESSAGIAEGGKTGLTAVTAGTLFLVALFLSPIFLAIPAFATAPALIIVGFLMMQQVAKIQWTNDTLTAVPAYITIFSMAFMYSISEGICFGVISYTILHVLSGKSSTVTPLMYILTVLFVLKYIFL
ncbi:MAG: NCS2 family permease [Selenomonadaceae bacterium]|nr:NCS2 family permease [Selenomonadaceae bacterium]